MVLKMVEAIHHGYREEAWRQRWLEERREAFTHIASHKDHQTIAAWESMEAEIDAEIIRRRSHIPSLSEDEQRVIALIRDTDLMVRTVYEFDLEPGTVRDDFTAHCTFIANALERLLNANRSA